MPFENVKSSLRSATACKVAISMGQESYFTLDASLSLSPPLVAVTHSVHGFDYFWVLGVFFNSFSELRDVLIQRTTVGKMILAPTMAKDCRSI